MALSGLASLPTVMHTPAAAAPAVSAGPDFGDSGVVRTPLRTSSEDFATSLTMGPDNLLVMTAGAGGDFGFARFSTGVSDVNGSFAQSRTTTDFGGTDDVARAVAATPSGGWVIAGSAGDDLALARYDGEGVLDRSFDGDGRVALDLGGAGDAGHAVVALADGRVVTVGGTATDLVVVRHLPDGRLDPAFGTGGRVTLSSSGPGRTAELHADGKLLVAGGGAGALAVYRLLDNGALDPSFGAGGVASLDLGAPARANAMVLAADGTITVAGSRGQDVVVARFDATGRPDPSFGTGGVTITPVAGGGAGQAIARRSDGALLVVGDAGDRGLIIRYRPDGTLHTAFNAGGVLVTRAGAGDQARRLRAVMAHPLDGWIVVGAVASDGYAARVYDHSDRLLFGDAVNFGAPRQEVTSSVVQPDGKVVALAEVGSALSLVRYHADGTRDTSFGLAGIAVSDRVMYPKVVALQPSGRILVAGGRPERPAIAGFHPDGSTDTGFGRDGVARFDLGGYGQRVTAMAVRPDGRILVTGEGDAGVALVRFTADGQLDTTFGQGGRTTAAASGYPGGAISLTVLGDGRLLALGAGPIVYRLHPDGRLDASFGAGGKVTLAPWFLSGPSDAAVQPDGRILVAGVTEDGDTNLTVVRLLPNGGVDPSWQVSPGRFRSFNQGTPANGVASTLAVQPDGKVVAGGTAAGTVALMRLHPDGTHDRSFGVDGVMVLAGVHPGRAPVLLVPTETSGMLVVATDGSGAWPATGVLVARVATTPLGAPTGVTAVAGSGSARVRWARPPLFDESPALAYRVTASDGIHSALTPDGEHFSAVVRGLTPGRPYTFTVHAVRAAGNGPTSAPSNQVTANMTGRTSAWGWNALSNLGDGTTVDRYHPVTGGTPGAVAVAGGPWHSLSLRADGTVWAWGSNGFGQLGDGTTVTRTTAVQVRGLTDVVAISAGVLHNVALRADGTVWAWGWNGVGQLGTGSSTDALVPIRVGGLSGVTSISAGFYHSLAARSDGTVAAWGWNILGQLGDGTTTDRWAPKTVPGLSGITAVAGGALHSLALVDDGTMRAWGWNGVWQLGTYDQVDRLTPAPVGSVTGVVAIAAGAHHNFALQKGGTVRSWGWNEFGQLGNPGTTAANGILGVWYLDDVATISSGWFHGLAIRHDGTVVAWGSNSHGQLGDGTTVSRNRFAPVLGTSGVAVAGGALHSLSA